MAYNKLVVDFTASNYGTIPTANVVATLTEPPSGVSLVKVSTSKGTYNSSTKEWTIGNLNPGQEVDIIIEYSITDINEAPFTFKLAVVSDQDDAGEETRVYTASDIFPCPDCPPPSITLNNTTWATVHGKVDFESNCQECDTEISVVPMSMVNVTSVDIDATTGFYSVNVTDKSQAWSFQVEGNCINCPYWCNGENDFGPYGPVTVNGPAPWEPTVPPRYEEDDIQSGDTIQLDAIASSVTHVYRNGILQPTSSYSFSGPSDEVVFNEDFDIGAGTVGESIIIFYIPA